MNKKILKLCVMFVACILLLGASVYAADLNANVSATTVELGGNFTVSVNSGKVLTDFEVAVSANGLTLPTVTANYSGSTKSTSGNKSIVKLFQLSASADKERIAAGTNLATFKYTVPSDYTSSSVTVTITLKGIDTDGAQVNTSTTKTVQVSTPKSTNNNLSSLKVNDELVSGFNKNTTSYTLATVENDVTTIVVSAVAEDEKATVTGVGTKTLSVGKNTINVKVTAESGATKTYVLAVTRKDVPKSTNCNLASLSVNGELVEGFNKDTLKYTLPTVETEVTSLTVAAVVEDSKAKVTGTGTVKLQEGKNTINVKVTAESGATKTYTLTVTRKESPKSTNCNLASLKVNGTAVKGFGKNVLTYTLESVENEVESIKVEGTAEDSKAKITGTGTVKLQEGSNTIKVVVTAESGATKTYTLTVTRKQKATVTLSNNANLTTLYVNGKAVAGFEPTKTEYTLEAVEYETSSIRISATAEDSKATVTGTGVKSVVVGNNKLDVVVTAEDGSVKVYSLNVTRNEKVELPTETVETPQTNNNNISVVQYVVIAVTAVLILIVVCLTVKSRRK